MPARRSGTATILFTDIVGSTELRTRLGDDRADELRRAHDEAWQEAVTANEGEVVKGLGDGVMAAFSGAGDAVAAAVAGQQRIGALGRGVDPTHELAVRVGISAGDVIWEDDDCHGTPVVIAARLCDAADGGQILCDDLVRGLARSRTDHDLVPAGERDLKGLDEPVVAYEVRWAPAATPGRVPLPGPLAPTPGEFPFAGRVAERATLADAWKTACTDGRTVVLISGEPGQGKTRLTAEAARAAHDQGAWVLAGGCDESVAAPYAPWLEILQTLVAHADEDALAGHVERTSGDLARLVPELGRRVTDLPPRRELDPETERLAIYDAVVDLLTDTARRTPLFVVVEDAHWADQASTALLRRLVSHLAADVPLALVVTYRDTDVDRMHPLAAALGDLRRAAGVVRISLRGMGDDDLEQLLAAAGGHDLDDDGRALAAALARETEGNPFFVLEVLRHLAETGVIVQDDGHWRGTVPLEEAGLPEGVREVVGQRLSRLSHEANETLRTAAVVGRDFDLDVVATVADQPEDAVLAHTEEALSANLVDEVPGALGRMSFSHALIRATLLEELSTTRRVRLHARIGTLLEDRPGATAAELAHHFGEAASAGLADKAVHHARAAATEAEERVAYAEAVSFYRRALEALDRPPDHPDRAPLLLAQASAAEAAGDVERSHRIAEEIAAIARANDDARLLVQAGCSHLGDWSMFAEPGDPDALGMIREGLERLDPDEVDIRAHGISSLVKAAIFDPDAVDPALPDEAIRLARASGDRLLVGRAIEAKHWALQSTGRPDESLILAEEAVATAEELDRGEVYASGAQFLLGRSHAELGDTDAARTAFHRAASYATPARGWFAANHEAAEAAAQGRWDDALEHTATARAIGRTVMAATADSISAGIELNVALAQGRIEDAQAAAATQHRTGIPGRNYLDARIALAAGDHDRAQRVARSWLGDAAVVPHFLVAFSFPTIARVAERTGDERLADWLRPRVAPLAGTFLASEVVINGPADHVIGLAEAAARNLDQAIRLLDDALAATRERAWHALVAEYLVDLARTLFRRDQPGDVDRARRRAEEAAAMAERLGMPLVTRDAAAVLGGVSPPG